MPMCARSLVYVWRLFLMENINNANNNNPYAMKKITNINTAYIESIRIYGPAYFTTHEYRHIYYKIIICRNWMVFSVRAEQVSPCVCVCAHRTKLSYLHARQRFFAIIFILNGIAMKRRLFIFYLFSHTHFSLLFFLFFVFKYNIYSCMNSQ